MNEHISSLSDLTAWLGSSYLGDATLADDALYSDDACETFLGAPHSSRFNRLWNLILGYELGEETRGHYS